MWPRACKARLAANGPAVVHLHELDRMLAVKGFAPGLRCRVYGVCGAQLAAERRCTGC